MGAVQKKTLSVVLALSLALSMLGAAGLQLLSAGTAYAAATLGTNLVYENVYGLMKPSDSQYAYAIMWNDDAVSTWDEKTGNPIPAKGTYNVVRSDGSVTLSFKESDFEYYANRAFYRWDGLFALKAGVYTLDGKMIAKPSMEYTYQGCKLNSHYYYDCGPCYYDETTRLLLFWNGSNVTVCKRDGSVVQTIAMPALPAGPQSGSVFFEYGKDASGYVVNMRLNLDFESITEKDFEKNSVPNDGWAVEEYRYYGHIGLNYGLRYNAVKGAYEKVKLNNYEAAWSENTWLGLEQDEWVPGTGDGVGDRQPEMSNGVAPYVLWKWNDNSGSGSVTTAQDAFGTPLFIAGYAIGAQDMKDNKVGFGCMYVYPQNQATGLYFAYKNGKYGVIDEKGNVKVPFEYDKFCNNTFSRTSIVLMKKGSAWSFIDLAKDQAQAAAKNDVSRAKVTVRSKVYTGKKLKPSTIKVVLNGKTLKKGTDYIASCSGGKRIGAYKVNIKGKGKYTGKTVSTFTIVPKKVAINKATALKRGFKASWKKPTKTYLKQTSGYQVRYAKDKAFKKGLRVKYVKKSSTTSLKVRGLSAGKTYYVQVRAYKTVGKVKYYSAWSKTVKVKTKRR